MHILKRGTPPLSNSWMQFEMLETKPISKLKWIGIVKRRRDFVALHTCTKDRNIGRTYRRCVVSLFSLEKWNTHIEKLYSRDYKAALHLKRVDLHQACLYPIETGGKRIRPLFLFADLEALGQSCRRRCLYSCSRGRTHSHLLTCP